MKLQKSSTAFLLLALPILAAVSGNVRGVVHDPDHRPVESAGITVRSLTSDYVLQAQTGPAGDFLFPAVPIGEYRVSASRDGFAAEDQVVTVESGSSPVLHFQFKLAAHNESVQVSENPDEVVPESSSAATMVGRRDIARTPGANRTNSVASITGFVPGAYVTHDQLHIRGGHQVSWLVDGVPVPNTNIASNAGPQFDPKDIDYLEVLRGGYSAEYGDRTYGVFNVAPRSGFERDRQGELVTSYGQFHQTNDQLSLGNHTARFAWYGSFNANRSDFGLQAPSPEIIHDRADGAGGFGSLIFNAAPTDQLKFIAALRRDDYQIPNSPAGQSAGIRDLDQERDGLVNFSWVHTIGHGVLLTVSPFYHFNRTAYLGGPADPGLSARDLSSSHYLGAQTTLGAVSRRHNLRTGIYGFAQRDTRTFEVTSQDGGFPDLRQTLSPSGGLAALFLEDSFKPTGWLTLNAGVRFTHFSGLVSENAADPRLGVALRLPGLRWVARASYGRSYQAPPLSTISGPALDFAVRQGLGFLPLHGERNEETQLGLAIPFRGWVLDGDHFHIHTRNFFDHNAIGNSNIFLPLTVSAARVDGWEATLRTPTLFRHGQAHLAFSRQRAEGAGAITGGLTDFAPPTGYFLLDHDQRHTLALGGDWNLPSRLWAAAALNYGSGFPDDGGPARLPGHATFDASLGRSWESCSFSVQAINLGNRRVLLDNSLTFGGTHYLEPRQIYAELRYRFHF